MSIQVLDGSGNEVSVETLPSVAQKSSALSLPVVLSTEQQAILDGQSPSETFFSVTPNDGADLAAKAKSIYIGGAGDISVVNAAGTAVVFKAVPVGTILPIKTLRVRSTGTTATFIIAF